MKFLAIDTSTKYSVAAVGNQQGLIYGCRRLFEKGRTESLVGLIKDCLKKAKVPLEKIDCLGVGVGPGSFTGLRIALSTVKALSYSLDKPCVAFSSLDAIAFNRLLPEGGRCVLVDARRSSVYCRFYKFNKRSKESRILLSDLRKHVKLPMQLSGDALGVYQDQLKNILGSCEWGAEKFWFPTPQSISRLTLEQHKSGRLKNCFELDAVYLYESDCQVKR
ncbi:MAG: tRNA (adenosine(37)-N6)-threonylcarbamoyltransferase complex dimerization subunit type 1 TsaB [Candidatus Omnitrophota bacterium]